MAFSTKRMAWAVCSADDDGTRCGIDREAAHEAASGASAGAAGVEVVDWHHAQLVS